MQQRDQSRARGLSAITLDQAIAGSSNVLISVLAARLLGAEAFGLFGVIFVAYVLVQGVARSLVGDPLLVHPEEATERPGEAIGTGIVLGLGLGVVLAASGAVALFWRTDLASGLLIMAVAMPLLVLQDQGRYLGFATKRPGLSLALDTAWLVLVVVGVVILAVLDLRSLSWFIAAWAGSGALASLWLFWTLRRHRLRASMVWLRTTWAFSWRYLMAFCTTQGSALVVTLALGAIAGAAALGGVRGALVLASPYMTIQIAAMAAGVSGIARGSHETDAVRRQVRRISVWMAAAAAGNAVVLVILPDRIGTLVLGETWAHAEPLMLPAGLHLILLALHNGARVGLLGTRAIETSLRLDLLTAPAIVAIPIVGAFLGGAEGYYWSVVALFAGVSACWWFVYSRHMSRWEPATFDARSGESAPDPATPEVPSSLEVN